MLSVLLQQRFGERGTGVLARIRKSAEIPLLEKLVEAVSQAGDWEEFEKLLP
jgi:hypothetical protein